jgi:hypothetical protein
MCAGGIGFFLENCGGDVGIRGAKYQELTLVDFGRGWSGVGLILCVASRLADGCKLKANS